MATNNATNTSNPITVSQGGTGASTLTGVLIGNGTSAVTASTVTQHNVVVAGASNALSTIAPGTSGNVLTSNGTDWTSAAAPGGGLISATATLTSAQVKTLNGTPVDIVSAPGSGKILVPVKGLVKLNYGGTNPFTAGSGQTIALTYNTVSTIIGSMASNAAITASANNYCINAATSFAAVAAASIENLPLTLFNPVGVEIGGNAAGNNTISFEVLYYIITL